MNGCSFVLALDLFLICDMNSVHIGLSTAPGMIVCKKGFAAEQHVCLASAILSFLVPTSVWARSLTWRFAGLVATGVGWL